MYSWTGCRQRWGKRGNYHIERGEDGGEGFKIDLIFLDPLHPSSPPCFLSFQFFFAVYSEHALSCFVRHKESTEKSWNGDGREDGARLWGKVNSELVFGEGPSRRCPLKKKCCWHRSRANDFRGSCRPPVSNSGLALRRDSAVVCFPLLDKHSAHWLICDDWQVFEGRKRLSQECGRHLKKFFLKNRPLMHLVRL